MADTPAADTQAALADAPDLRAGAARLPGVAKLIAAQVGYQLRLLTRTPRAIFASLLLPVLLLVLRIRGDSHPGGTQATALVAGLAVFGVLSTAYVTHASGLVTARENGTLRRWRATPAASVGLLRWEDCRHRAARLLRWLPAQPWSMPGPACCSSPAAACRRSRAAIWPCSPGGQRPGCSPRFASSAGIRTGRVATAARAG